MKKICKDVEFGDLISMEVIDISSIEGWCDMETAKSLTPWRMMAAGFFISEDDDFVRVAGLFFSADESRCGGVRCIPKSLIVQLGKIDKMKKIYETDKFDNYYKILV